MNLGRLTHGRRVLAGFCGATVVQVAAVAFDVKILKQASKVTLMPLLWQWSRTQDAPPLLQAALLASAAGDLLLETDAQLAGIAAFAAAHACYLAVFLANPAQRSWRVLAAYAALWAALIAVLSPGLDGRRVPVAAYALLLTATAVASRWHNSRSGVGGALFLVSDALIALRMSGRDFPGRGTLTMSTYAVGQYLLASGVTKSDR
ncbi:lysoplasmalogenase family protein [Kribbella pratensis]|uniref:Membrane protein YhhN n=1 Tax=Kribbella pratensis TaxID=2512112 RepID=A0A4R8CLU7_9ACTN|nr:lysoplasmalogenase family protein [Kribbella pratensis]TDW77036.1 putative membrane protein YhhN [Kribbella pratensis]